MLWSKTNSTDTRESAHPEELALFHVPARDGDRLVLFTRTVHHRQHHHGVLRRLDLAVREVPAEVFVNTMILELLRSGLPAPQPRRRWSCTAAENSGEGLLLLGCFGLQDRKIFI
jgi:hypothetical protein